MITDEQRAENRRINAILDAVEALSVEETLALVKDAERYRWLRDNRAGIGYTFRPGETSQHVEIDTGPMWLRRADLDAAIDAAIRAPAPSAAQKAE